MNFTRFYFYLIVFGILGLGTSYGQDEFLDKEFVNTNFEGGYDGYVNFFESNLTFPQKSFKKNIEGLNLFYYEVTPNKKTIKIKFLTLLDKEIEKNIRTTVQASRSLWKMKNGGPFRIYQSIVYSNLPYYPQTFVGDLPELPLDLPIKFQELIVKIKSNQSDVAITEARKNKYVKVLNLYEQRAKKKTYRAAYYALCELIRYNPLNREFLIARIKLEQRLGVNKYQVYDSYLLSDFVDKGDYVTQKSFKPVYENAMDSIYSDGKIGFQSYIHNNLEYPELSIQNKIQGAIIVAISGSKQEGVKFEFLTQLDDEIESMLTELLVERQDSWKTFDTPYTFYQPVLFSLNMSYPDQFSGQVDGFNIGLKQPFLTPAFITEAQDPHNSKENQHVLAYNKSKGKVESNMKKGKSKKVLKDLNLMLRYNPLDSTLLELRIAIEKELGKPKFTANDLRILEALKQQRG